MPIAIVLLGAVIGAFGAIAAQLVNNLLTSGRESRHFRLETLERFRSQFRQDAKLSAISYKEGPLTDREVDEYVGFWEELGLYYSMGLVDVELIDEIFGDSILECYEDKDIMRSVGAARGEEKDPTYFVHFENLARVLAERKKNRTGV